MLACCCFHSFFHRLLFLPQFTSFFLLGEKERLLSLSINHLRSLSESFLLLLLLYDYTNTARAFVVVIVLFSLSQFNFCLFLCPSLSDVWSEWRHVTFFPLYVCMWEWVCVSVFKGTVCISCNSFDTFFFLMMNKSNFYEDGRMKKTRG